MRRPLSGRIASFTSGMVRTEAGRLTVNFGNKNPLRISNLSKMLCVVAKLCRGHGHEAPTFFQHLIVDCIAEFNFCVEVLHRERTNANLPHDRPVVAHASPNE